MISGNYGIYNNQQANVSYGAVKDHVPNNVNEKLPENIKNIDAEQIASNNAAVGIAKNANKETALLTLPIYTSFIALRSLNDSTKGPFRFAGEYEKTILGKLAKAGDVISNGASKLVPESIKNGSTKAFSNAKNWLLDHSAILRSFTTPTRYENSMAIDNLFSRVIRDDGDIFTKGFKGTAKELGDLFEPSSFRTFLDKNGFQQAIDADDIKQAKSILSDVFTELASKPVKDKNIQQYTKDIINSLSKSDKTAVIDKWGFLPIGKIPVLGKFLTLNVPMSEIANKLRVGAGISGDDIVKAGTAGAVGVTAIGRALPSVFAKVYEGLTSDFVGGKIAPALQAFFLAQAVVRAKDAPEGQKLATFMDEEASAASFLITMPIATSILSKIAGMKYIGMGKDAASQSANVQKYRDMIKDLNKRVDARSISRGEYLAEAEKIKELFKGKGVDGKKVRFWQKPFKAIGKFLGSHYEKETIKPFIEEVTPDMKGLKALGLNTSNKVQTLLYKFKTGSFNGPDVLKNITPGGLMRFALVMFVLSPLVTKPIQWCVNKIFGKPYDPEKAKAEEAKKQQEEAMKNNPFANMTENELAELLSKNQHTLAQIQNDPQLMKELETNPQKLYELLQNGANNANQPSVPNAAPQTGGVAQSPLLKDYINSINNTAQNPQIQPSTQFQQPQANLFPNNQMNQNQKMPAPSVQNNNEQSKNSDNKPFEVQRTYIPSSKPSEAVLRGQAMQNEKFNAIIADMDKTEQEFSQYLGGI